MKGLEIAKSYFNQFGVDMIEKQFADKADRIAAGLCGEGSECFGFDDEISKDHDFDPGFMLFITEEDEKDFGFRLERAYAKLPKEYMGLKKQPLSPVGGNRRGVVVIEEFYKKFLGRATPFESAEEWLYAEPAMLAAATNGEVFVDKPGKFSAVRNSLKKGYPEDVRKKKLSAHLAFMAQAGQYNYPRLIRREETGAAGLAIFEFVKHAISAVYLLNNAYEPFYKWAYRGMRDLNILSDLEMTFTGLTEVGNDKAQAEQKQEIIDDVAMVFASTLGEMGLTDAVCNDLNKHAVSVADKISDPNIRNMHLLQGV